MANGYGGSSGSSSSSGTTSSTRVTSTTQRPPAPEGFHYMPDGTLMSDAEHAKLYGEEAQVDEAIQSTQHANKYYNPYERDPVGVAAQTRGVEKNLTAFILDLSDLPAASETREFTILGEKDAEFILEIKNEDNYYYNFTTNAFQVAQSRLEKNIGENNYKGSITFPAVGDNDQYDIYLYVKPGTLHSDYKEIRFEDGSIDINSSSGSNSLMMQKVIYQYTDLTLTISKYSPNGTIEMTGTGHSTDSLTVSRLKRVGRTPFSLTSIVSTASKAYQILKQPTLSDLLSFVSVTVGSAPELLPGEDIYPTARAAFTGDDVNGAVTSGAIVRMDNSDLSEVIAVGDKVTATTSNDDVDGATSGIKVVMDNNVATKMAVGDQVTSALDSSPLNASVITVAALNPDTDNVKEFSLSEAVELVDDERLIFSSKVNRELTTVTVVETGGAGTDFTMSRDDIQLRDNQELTFTPQKNYQWPLDDVSKITAGMIAPPSINVTADTIVKNYEDSITIFEDTEEEEIIIKNSANFKDTKGSTPTVTNGVITAQTGNIVFNNQQALALAGDAIKIGGYGKTNILKVSGYDLRFTDLKLTLAPITTTTTAVVDGSATVPVSSVLGILPNVSTVSGIGINAGALDPTVTARSATSGAGNLTLSAVQTLESGITLTFPNAGQKATITGSVEILKAGTASATVYFDVEKLLSIT